MGQMVPQYPQGSFYPGRPRVTASDLRYEWELAANVGSILVGLLLLLLVGQFVSILLAMALPVVFFVLGMVFVNLSNKGSMVQISEVQFPHLYRLAIEVGHNLDMPVPAIFIKQSPIVNAFATGLFGQRTVVLHSALVEQMNQDEIKAIIAHEFGHIKMNHVVYYFIQNLTVGNFLGQTILMPIRWLFFFASRAAEYSADQAALVGTMNVQACVTSEIKLAVGAKLYEQMNIQAYLMQIEEFSHTTGSKFIEILNDQTHPMTVNRILHVIRFYRSPKYQQLAAGHGRSGTTTLTSGYAGTRDLFQRVAAKAEYERDVQRHAQNLPGPQGYQQVPSAVTPPSISCGACGMPMDAQSRFCVRCGTPVAGPVAASPQPLFQPGAAPVEAPSPRVVRRVVRGSASELTAAANEASPLDAAVAQPPATAPQATCAGCGQPLATEARFCANCGRPHQ